MRRSNTGGLVRRAALAAAFAMLAQIALLPGSTSSGHADAYPSRIITLIVPNPAGSGSDLIARILAENMSEILGARIVVDNRAGAVGAIGTAAAARAAPDGYTIALANNGTHASNKSMFKDLKYDPVRDFAPIALAAKLNYLLLVSKDVPAASMDELVALAAKQPGQLSYAAGTVSAQILGSSLERGTGISLLKVPYRSNAQATTDVVSGRVTLTFADIAVGIPFMQGGQLRPLAVTSRERSVLTPDVPTLAETVLPGFELVAWTGLVAPAGTPREIVDRLARAMLDVLGREEVKRRLLDLGAEVDPMGSDEFGRFVASEVDKWARLVREAGLQPE